MQLSNTLDQIRVNQSALHLLLFSFAPVSLFSASFTYNFDMVIFPILKNESFLNVFFFLNVERCSKRLSKQQNK